MEILKYCIQYASKQNQLLDIVMKDIIFDSHLSNFPKSGKLTCNGFDWVFQKHGAGICFINCETNEEIDAHKSINIRNGFDPWRISVYLMSLHISVIYYLHDIIYTDDYSGMNNLFLKLCQDKLITLIEPDNSI